MIARIFLFQSISYVIFMVSELLFAGGGHGSYAPYAIFWGFFGVPFMIYSEPTGLIFWIPPAIQSFVVGVFVSRILQKNSLAKYFWNLIFTHFVGVCFALYFYQTSESFSRLSLSFATGAYLTAIAISILYWVLLYRLTTWVALPKSD